MEAETLKQILENDILSDDSKTKLESLYSQISPKQFSDLLDEHGNQYVEFVQEGGGVWGTALVGYLYGLEIFGIRFLKVAGTSAGAINTMLIAACKTKEEPKSEIIRKILFDWDFSKFMDGKNYVKTFARGMLNHKKYLNINIYFTLAILLILGIGAFVIPTDKMWQIKILFGAPVLVILILSVYIWKYYSDLRSRNSGLNPGREFLETMREVLESENFDVKTVAQLNKRFSAKESALNLTYRYGNGPEYFNIAISSIEKIKEKQSDKMHIEEKNYKVFYDDTINNSHYRNNPFFGLKTEYALITTDINAKIKVQLPTMANLYWSEEELKKTSPAEFVRASMSVPFFFEPFQKLINKDEDSVKYAWKFWMSTPKEEIRTTGIFVDGGVISNFPIDLFHSNDIFYPRLPLFGVQLTSDAEKASTSEEILKNPVSFAMNIFDTLKGFNDKSFLTKNSFYKTYSIQTINCGSSSWLNFFMEPEEKKALFNAGFKAALDFLHQFDWEKYKYERMMLALKERKILKEEDVPTVG